MATILIQLLNHNVFGRHMHNACINIVLALNICLVCVKDKTADVLHPDSLLLGGDAWRLPICGQGPVW